MKIIVKQKDWSKLKTDYEEEFVHEFVDGVLTQKNIIYVAQDEVMTVKGNEKVVNFAFKVLKKTEDSIKLKVFGIGAGFVEERKQTNPFVLKLGETQSFSTNSFDSGSFFEVTLVE
ncbi:MAG: hypothetical protein E7359_04365 [Clostridiales bacterium]|nr:hypothetical protein [Clostridiales bacterium]